MESCWCVNRVRVLLYTWPAPLSLTKLELPSEDVLIADDVLASFAGGPWIVGSMLKMKAMVGGRRKRVRLYRRLYADAEVSAN